LAEDAGYRRELEWLFSLSPGGRALAEQLADKPRKVPRTRALLERLGSPHLGMRSVLIAGTKGKGSTAAMIEAIARGSGLRTGLYTQPHLHSWRERTRIDGSLMSEREAARLLAEVREAAEAMTRDAPALGPPTTFEVGTVFTLAAFARVRVDLAVVEVGVGGLHDATNVVDPELVVLTAISYDHVDTLGSTLTEIAGEKAGIVRVGRPVVVGLQFEESMRTIERMAAERDAPLVRLGHEWSWRPREGSPGCGSFDVHGPAVEFADVRTGLLGRHQRDNATLAIAASHALGTAVDGMGVRGALATVEWPGRLQTIATGPTIVVDAAHNADSAARLMESVHECVPFDRLHVVLGVSTGKDLAGILEELLPHADTLIATRSTHGRAMAVDELAGAIGARAIAEPDIGSAIARARSVASADDLILVTGSLFLVAEAIRHVAGLQDVSSPTQAH
jgi:dihydrofolate synthase/folylpolyglutamate synthase